MSRISRVFSETARERRMAFMPFITAGDPDLTSTSRLLSALSESGVDLIELGFPYSDPIADGPVIQDSYTRALNNGVTVDGILDMVGDLPTDRMPPLLAMVSFAIVFRRGPDPFLKAAADAGFSGLIIPDLPADESGDFGQRAQQAGLDLIPLMAPTTSVSRTDVILQAARGFVYCMSVAGTTGVRQTLPQELSSQLKDLRKRTSLPLAVGFGISRLDHAAALNGLADGIIVGSAMVRLVAEATSGEEAVRRIQEFARQMTQAVRQVTPSLSGLTSGPAR